ncbi:MAG: macrolide-specific efflux protein macA, partial [Marinobacter sp. T13-3]
LQVPASAVFKRNGSQSVFVVRDGVANLQAITTGQSNGLTTAVTDGLGEGDQVVRHPGRELSDGDRVRVR